MTRLPGYKLHKIGQYRSRKLGLCWPRLHDVVHGETMATSLLQLDPQKRLGADEAMVHPYFNGLPKKLLELPDGECTQMPQYTNKAMNFLFATIGTS